MLTDLQSVPINHSGIDPIQYILTCHEFLDKLINITKNIDEEDR